MSIKEATRIGIVGIPSYIVVSSTYISLSLMK